MLGDERFQLVKPHYFSIKCGFIAYAKPILISVKKTYVESIE